jgi:hypothetical protein
MTVRNITFGEIEDAAFVADIDDAIARLQAIAGITDGGVASVAFSGFDWDGASATSRIERICRWMVSERIDEVD